MVFILSARNKIINNLLLMFRLNLTPTLMGSSGSSSATRSGTPSRRTPTRALKRKRTMLEESSSYTLSDFLTTTSAKGDVEIVEVEPEGKFIRLNNKGEKVGTTSIILVYFHLAALTVQFSFLCF